MRKSLLGAALILVAASPASAQWAWDAPSFFSPRSHDDIGIYAVVPDDADFGVMGLWRQSGNLNLGVRVALIEDVVSLGAEFYNPIRAVNVPLSMAWNLGFGAGFGDDVTMLRVPFGVSIGATLGSSGSLQLTPYVHPRIALDVVAVDVGDDERTDTDVNFDVDLGADLNLTPSLILRFGATVGENEAFGLGVAFRMGRRMVVR